MDKGALTNEVVNLSAQLAKELAEELNAARELQISLLPHSYPTIPGYEIAARSVPAREVGGDFYDFIRVDDTTWGFLIGDISGKGITGAMMMAATRNTFRALAKDFRSSQLVLDRVNSQLVEDTQKRMYAAVSYCVLNSRNHTVTVANAGLEPVLCRAGAQTCKSVESPGNRYPLGITRGTSYQSLDVPMQPGDILLLVTDGMAEAMNPGGEPYGYDRLTRFALVHAALSAEAMVSAIFDEVERWRTGGLPSGQPPVAWEDDVTVVVLKAIERAAVPAEITPEILPFPSFVSSDIYAVLMEADRADQRYELTEALTTIGRDERNALVLYDPRVAHEHAVIERIGEVFILRNLGETPNAILVNGKPIQGACELADGDRIHFGPSQYVFHVHRHTLTPGDAEAHFLRGRALHKAGEYARAQREYIEAIRQDAGYAPVHFNLGILLQQQGELDNAIACFQKGLSYAPDDALAHANLGKLYEEKGLWQEALAEGAKAAALDARLARDVARRQERIQRKATAALQARAVSQNEPLAAWDIRELRVLQNDLFTIEMDMAIPDSGVRTVINILREAYQDIGSGDKLDFQPDHIQVALYATSEAYRRDHPASGRSLPPESVGYYDGTTIHVRLPDTPADLGALRVNLRHEYVHLLVHQLAVGRCPAWLNEGLAEHEARSLLASEWALLTEQHAAGALPSLATLFQDLAIPYEQVHLAYLTAYAAVDFLIRAYGWHKIRQLLCEHANTSDEEALRKSPCFSVSELENALAEHVMRVSDQQRWEVV